MLRRGRKSWITATVVLALLVTASPGRAAARIGHGKPLASWEGLWEWALAWLGADGHGCAAASAAAREKTSSQIDPNGQPTPTSTTQSDTSAGIDPLGGH